VAGTAANPHYACQAEQFLPAARSINLDTPKYTRTGMGIASDLYVSVLLILIFNGFRWHGHSGAEIPAMIELCAFF